MSKGEKRPLSEAMETAQHIIGVLSDYCQRIEIAGSLRRERPLIGDIEIVAIPKYEKDLFGIPDMSRNELKHFLIQSGTKMTKCGDKYIQFTYGGWNVDLFMPNPTTWGSVFTIRTGSHEFNMWLMTVRSQAVGVRFSDGILFDRYTRDIIPTPEEADVFKALHMAFVPPNMRDDNRWHKYIHAKEVSQTEESK